MGRFDDLVAPFVEDPAEVVVAIETDLGLFVAALTAAGYRCWRVLRNLRLAAAAPSGAGCGEGRRHPADPPWLAISGGRSGPAVRR